MTRSLKDAINEALETQSYMHERPFVILVDWRHPTETGVTTFVASSWEKVEEYVLANQGFDDSHGWYWWAQVNYIDEPDIFANLGEIRNYDQYGRLEGFTDANGDHYQEIVREDVPDEED